MNDGQKLFDDSPVPPGQILQQMLDERGWTHEELAAITGRTRPAITEIVTGKRGITPEMAIALAAAFNNSATYWLHLDTAFRLASAPNDFGDVQKRARLYEMAPIKDMQRRGWIKSSKSMAEIESELTRFFGVDSLLGPPEFPISLRKSDPLADLTSSQRAWCFRVRQLAGAMPTTKGFDGGRVSQLKRDLRILAAYPAEASHVSGLMQKNGIRFVIVEPLPGPKLDGCAFWIDECSPVIGLSIRIDRHDYFWFTLMHELAHIENGDGLSVDMDLVVEERTQPLMKADSERKADESAAEALIPAKELDSFIRRVGPIYAKPNIIQFAHRIKIHPGIIVGQLQHRAEIGFQAHREMLPKVRDHVIGTALTDGWGNHIAPGCI